MTLVPTLPMCVNANVCHLQMHYCGHKLGRL